VVGEGMQCPSRSCTGDGSAQAQAPTSPAPGEIRPTFWPGVPGNEHLRGAAFEPLLDANWTYIPQHVDHDFSAEGSVVIVPIPGHPIRQLSQLVKLPRRNFILTGDTQHLRHSLTNDAAGPPDLNSWMAIHSIRRLGRLKESFDASFHISHHSEHYAELGHSPEYLQ
jgi:N-acyl homoserine lactone hydrolase